MKCAFAATPTACSAASSADHVVTAVTMPKQRRTVITLTRASISATTASVPFTEKTRINPASVCRLDSTRRFAMMRLVISIEKSAVKWERINHGALTGRLVRNSKVAEKSVCGARRICKGNERRELNARLEVNWNKVLVRMGSDCSMEGVSAPVYCAISPLYCTRRVCRRDKARFKSLWNSASASMESGVNSSIQRFSFSASQRKYCPLH